MFNITDEMLLLSDYTVIHMTRASGEYDTFVVKVDNELLEVGYESGCFDITRFDYWEIVSLPVADESQVKHPLRGG